MGLLLERVGWGWVLRDGRWEMGGDIMVLRDAVMGSQG